jgi:hypothetical protein
MNGMKWQESGDVVNPVSSNSRELTTTDSIVKLSELNLWFKHIFNTMFLLQQEFLQCCDMAGVWFQSHIHELLRSSSQSTTLPSKPLPHTLIEDAQPIDENNIKKRSSEADTCPPPTESDSLSLLNGNEEPGEPEAQAQPTIAKLMSSMQDLLKKAFTSVRQKLIYWTSYPWAVFGFVSASMQVIVRVLVDEVFRNF